MAWMLHFLLTRPFPARLHYANGSIALEIIEASAEAAPWQFRARRLDRGQTVCVIWRAATRRELERDLYEAGFPAERQFLAPSRKIMERLEREGFAQSANLKIHSKTGLRC